MKLVPPQVISFATFAVLAIGAFVAVPGGNAAPDKSAAPIPWPDDLPVYKHIVIVVEENKDFEQIIDEPITDSSAKSKAPFINLALRKEGALFTKMFGEEHHSQGNYFWLFSGSNQGVGFRDGVPDVKIKGAPNLGASLIDNKRTFKGYSEDLPAIGSEVLVAPPEGKTKGRAYARKHVPWISFDNVPNKDTVATSSNLRFKDFPKDAAGFASLPTVAIVIPNLKNDMHDSEGPTEEDTQKSARRGDTWLKDNLGEYYEWAKSHDSLLIVTWDENDDKSGEIGLTDPFAKAKSQSEKDLKIQKDRQNRVCTIFAGAHIKPGTYEEGEGITHVNILRTLEAMYGLPRAGAQQPNATTGGITDRAITDVFKKN